MLCLSEYAQLVYRNLLNISSHVHVWKKENIPKELHYQNNPRIPPILLAPHDHWFLVDNESDKLPMRK